MQKYVVLEKAVGQTPLECAEAWRATQSPACKDVPLAYAGRLDPMASGKLLVRIGDECKVQEQYHKLDKGYTFSVLFGIATDTADVLGRMQKSEPNSPSPILLQQVTKKFIGDIALPYPHFSSKTVQGKPLHVWTLEGRLNEITIPTNASTIYKLKLLGTQTLTGQAIFEQASQKIESIAPVTDSRKALGNDFRRVDIRADWKQFIETHREHTFLIADFYCVASSGTYMRTLAEEIAKACDTVGLAFAIHRTAIGRYIKIPLIGGIWLKRY